MNVQLHIAHRIPPRLKEGRIISRYTILGLTYWCDETIYEMLGGYSQDKQSNNV